jgi:hypothetical protein
MRKIITTVVIAAAAVGITATSADATPRRPAVTNPNATCLVAFPGNVTQDAWDRLLKLGWKGDPTDGRTQLWSPGCLRDGRGAVLPIPGHVVE